jgi:hypothetical protein
MLIYTDRIAADAPSTDERRALFVVREGQARPSRLTYGPWRDSGLRVLNTGQVVFRRQPVQGGTGEPWLAMIRPDGTGVMAALPFCAGEPETSAKQHDQAAGLPGEVPPRPMSFAKGSRLLSLVDEKRTTGTLLCLNSYFARPGPPQLEPGSVAEVVVLTDPADGPVRERRAPVQPDGSFMLEVPADTALEIRLVGRTGDVLRACGGKPWVRPGENRGCIGCHEPAGEASLNRFPMALEPSPPRQHPAGERPDA